MMNSISPPPSLSTVNKLTARSAPSTRYKFMKRHRAEAKTSRIVVTIFLSTLCFVFVNLFGGKVEKSSGVSLRGVINTSTKNRDHMSNVFLRKGRKQLTDMRDFTHLIIVAGHSVIMEGALENAGIDENVWYLLDYQKGKGLPQAILMHIQAGIAEAAKDPNSLLVFSGGQTRPTTGPIDEGGSYYRVADAMNLWGNTDVRTRTITEEFATDSFQNLLYSICRFKEIVSKYPKKITMVSYSFKRKRFEGLHAPALHIPAPSFNYIGLDPPASTGFDYLSASNGEEETAALFEKDPYGCNSGALQEKRKMRNPFFRTPWYDMTCPDMKKLMHWCGPNLFPKNQIQWIL